MDANRPERFDSAQSSAALFAGPESPDCDGPLDIADGIVFLASDESRYMTGSELVIDGGWSAR